MKVKTRMCTIIIYTWVPYGIARIFPSIHMLNKAKNAELMLNYKN